MPLEVKEIQDRVRTAEAEIRRLRSRLDRLGSLGEVRASQISGILQPGNGGTGISCSILGSVSPWENNSGAPQATGTVVIEDGDRLFNVTTTASDRRVIGVVSESAIAAGSSGCIRHGGYQATVLVQDAVAAGDYLVASTTSGRAASAGTTMAAGVFAIALTAKAGAGPGTVSAMMLGGAVGSSGASGAPANAEYLVLTLEGGTLTQERRFVAGAGLTASDGGANGDYTLAVSGGGTGAGDEVLALGFAVAF